MDSIENIICKAIEIYSQATLNKVNRDITIIATITDYVNPLDYKTSTQRTGLYRVTYQDATFNCYASHKSLAYNVGDRVYILIVQGNFAGEKIIIGAVTPDYEYDQGNNNTQNQSNDFNVITRPQIDALFG